MTPLLPNDSPDDPHRLAERYLSCVCGSGPLTLRYWRGEFVAWRDGAYSAQAEGDIRATITEFIRMEFRELNLREQERRSTATKDEKNEQPVQTRKVSTRLVADVMNALRSICLISSSVNAPAWLDNAKGPDPLAVISTPTGILDVAAFAEGKPNSLLSPTPMLFTFTALPFGFDPNALPPRQWLAFLRDLWPDDPASIETLQEWFGLLLTPDTRQQKMLFLIGPRRAGKGTITRVLKEIVGVRNVAGPTLNSIATNFGLSPLLDKSVAIVDDARLSQRSDAAVAVERLLTITGEGTICIDRKFLPQVNVKLPTRFVVVTNELPRLGDTSGALTGRLILLRFIHSFFGREDHTLTERLLTERTGILLWALEGWTRLQSRGRFVQPASGAKLLQELEDLCSPMAAFLRDRCIIETDARVEVDALFREWKAWCEVNGRKEHGSEQLFGRDLRAIVPGLEVRRPKRDGVRWREYQGIRLQLPDEVP